MSDEEGEVRTEMAALFHPDVEAADKSYITLRDREELREFRRFAESLWEIYEPYADPDFVIAAANDFHQRFWEMYLTCAILQAGHTVVPRRSTVGPDVCVEDDGRRIWIEAVAPGPGTGPDSVPEIECDLVARDVPDEEALLRYRSAIEAKHGVCQKYLKEAIIQPGEPFIIALNERRSGFARIEFDVPRAVSAVYPLGPPVWAINLKTEEVSDLGPSHRPLVLKRSGKEVRTDVFLDLQYSGISALISSAADVYNHPAGLGEDFQFIHNALASNPLPKGWLPLGKEYWPSGGSLEIITWGIGPSAPP